MTKHPKLQELLDRYHRGECRPDEILLLILSLEIHMSAQLDQLTAAQATTTANVAALTAAVAAVQKPDDLTQVIAQETANAAAVAAATAALATPTAAAPTT